MSLPKLAPLFLVIGVLVANTHGQNIDCHGKGFFCVNSTHFLICVDMGNGLIQTVDNFAQKCPPGTFCDNRNLFECMENVDPHRKIFSPLGKVFSNEATVILTTPKPATSSASPLLPFFAFKTTLSTPLYPTTENSYEFLFSHDHDDHDHDHGHDHDHDQNDHDHDDHDTHDHPNHDGHDGHDHADHDSHDHPSHDSHDDHDHPNHGSKENLKGSGEHSGEHSSQILSNDPAHSVIFAKNVVFGETPSPPVLSYPIVINNNIACTIPGQYPDEDSCHSYYSCNNNVRYKLVCSYNTVYSPTLQKCTTARDQCMNYSEYPCSRAGRFPDTKSCYSYFDCSPNGSGYSATRYHCPWYSTFQPSNGHCVKSNNVCACPQIVSQPQPCQVQMQTQPQVQPNSYYDSHTDASNMKESMVPNSNYYQNYRPYSVLPLNNANMYSVSAGNHPYTFIRDNSASDSIPNSSLYGNRYIAIPSDVGNTINGQGSENHGDWLQPEVLVKPKVSGGQWASKMTGSWIHVQ